MKQYDYLIVGAGLFGAVFAHEAKKAGKKCLVIDKRDHIAGNIYTENVEGINVHRYGAHIFHTNNKAVWQYVNQFAEFNRYTNSPVANYHGQIYNLPFNMNTFNKMWGVVTPAEAKAKIEEQKAAAGITDPQNLEEQAISLVGTDIYEKLIKGYTGKQWGRPCTELPAFIIKRLPVRFTYDDNYFNALYQGIPNGGYTAMVEKMLDGTEVRLGVDYLADRDALNALAAGKYRGDLPANTILTPHPGEAARLLGLTVPEVQADREGAAVSLAEKYHCVAVLKGHHTLVAAPDGTVWRNETGNAGLAKGGSGDILAGLTAGLLAAGLKQGRTPEDAAVCAVWLHGAAADRCAKRRSMTAMLPGDLFEDLGWILGELGR